MRKRIDRFIEDALGEFGDWYVNSDWLGKERDFVNMLALNFLAKSVQPGAAITELGQIRIESPAPQPPGFAKITAAKDLVIWNNSQDTVWDKNWNASKYPRVVLEWKIKRTGKPPKMFDNHDVVWLSGFTGQYQDTFGYLIRVYDGPQGRSVDWAKVRDGVINDTNRRS
jgi:hypothetical protein